MNENKRQQRKYIVLGHIIHAYVSQATPISSKIVAQRMDGSVSSATIRNIMSELEHQGYIVQPHTSAGRVPTNLGYRHYVDMAKDNVSLQKRQAERLAAEYDLRIRTIKDVIEKTSFLISRELHNAGVVMWPSIEDHYLKHLELIKVRSETVLAILVTITGAVKNHVIKLERDLDKAELEKVANYINDNYEKAPFNLISENLKKTELDASGEVSQIAHLALGIIDSVIEESMGNDICWEGLNYFMDEPEFRNVKVTRSIIEMFSGKGDLVRIMRKDLNCNGVRIYIGEENECEMLNECSIVTCGYTLHDRLAGRIGVIGPTRMDYDHARSTVSCLSELISSKLEEINC